MKTVLTKDLKDHIGKEVSLKGWIYNIRSSGKLFFLQFRDGYGYTQAIVSEKEVDDKVWKIAGELTMESSVELIGEVSKHPKKEEYELQVKEINVYQIAEEYPISKKDHGPDFLLDNRHLWLRSTKQLAIMRVRNTIINATYEHLNKENFIKVDTPILTPTSCEGTTTLFEVDYFEDDKAYLSQSGQLYLEAATMASNRCFDFGPTFRAEKSKTRRHLTEFWMMDAEAAFVEHEENMKIQEKLILYIVEQVLKNNKTDLEILERDTKALEKIKAPFPRMSHAEAVVKLNKMGSDIKPDEDFGGDDETNLTKGLDSPLFVDLWPRKIKAFYMKQSPDNPDLVLGSDLIAPEGYGEIIGGSQREDDYDILLKSMKDFNLDPKPFQWYLDLRKYGSVPHSGFGYGLERLTGWMCGTQHIRETIAFPRLINRLSP
ncbi:asparagine--tRNA ligase [Patescibacteria group bacterium]|nr:asparagine--tRNA ligase [Patescibacteria group bacterium]MBU1673950.1 asparagine--tRNA ligase [Patescibacteria group bacterium]MBU1963944.1 asparagine--tRNA ligase [Patescibacteria group bacterium]